VLDVSGDMSRWIQTRAFPEDKNTISSFQHHRWKQLVGRLGKPHTSVGIGTDLYRGSEVMV
jgi:hypothetical protein